MGVLKPCAPGAANYAGEMLPFQAGELLAPLVEPRARLSDAELSRTARHRRLAGLETEGQRRIASARVAVIGAGGLGAPVVLALAAAGVGELVVFDDDVIELSNLQRQVIHRTQDVGAPKADSAVRVAAELSETRVRAEHVRLTTRDAAERLAGVDLVIDGTDSFESREIVAQACERLGLPLVWGTVQEFAGQVTVFWSAPPEGVPAVRLHDLYPPGSEAPACSAVGVFGPLCLQVGALMASEALKLVTGIGRPLIGRVALLDALGGTQREVPLRASRANDAAAPTSGNTAMRRPPVPEVDDLPGAAAADVLVLDVRNADEPGAGRIPGSELVPLRALLRDVDGTVSGLGLHGRDVVVVCEVGVRARVAAAALNGAGAHASVLRGGMEGWARRRPEQQSGREPEQERARRG